MMKTPLFLCILWLTFACALPCAWSHARHHHTKSSDSSRPAVPVIATDPLDLTPVTVLPYAVSGQKDPTRAAFQAKMHQEAGLDVPATRWITADQVTSRSLFILQITQSLEGGFDSVNLHDRGVVSWGIMQWAAHCGSLGDALTYIKRRLLEQHERAVWDKVFVSNGLDADAKGLIVYGKPVTDAASARLAFRGSVKPGNADPKLLMHWAMTFGRAGRQPQVAALEVEYAGRIVDAILQKRLPNLPYHGPGRDGLTVDDLAGNDPYAEALVFAIWTNNPKNAFSHVADAARATRALAATDDPAFWPPLAFGDALMRRCQTSSFGNWPQRAAMIAARQQAVRSALPETLTPFERDYQSVLGARKMQRRYEVASRHQQEQRVRAGDRLRAAIALAVASRRKQMSVPRAAHDVDSPPPSVTSLFVQEEEKTEDHDAKTTDPVAVAQHGF